MTDTSGEIELAKSVGSVVYKRRMELGWTQRQLHQALASVGAKWSRAAVGSLESNGVRGERISDLTLLCYVLNLTLDELLAGDHDVRMRDGNVKSLPWVRAVLRGDQADRFEPAGTGIEPDMLDEQKLADYVRSAASMTEKDLKIFVTRFSSALELEPSIAIIRDNLAGLTSEMSKASVQSKRGHAARKLRDLAIVYKSGPEPEEVLADFLGSFPSETPAPNRGGHGDD